MKEIIISIFSGVVGVILTIGYQHFFAPDPTIIVNVGGEEVEVTSSNYEELSIENESLRNQNDLLSTQNTKYYDELEDAKDKIAEYESQSNSKVQELEQQLNDMPDIQFKDIGLSVNGEDIAINPTRSSVVIDNKTYYSDELVYKLIDPNSNISIQDNIIYIGKIVKEKSNLSNEWILNNNSVVFDDSITDSYGNMHTNSMRFCSDNGSIIYNLNSQYSLLKCDISICNSARMNKSGVITIIADDTIVYTSPVLTKITEPFTEEDIPINNCKLLTIKYNADSSYNQCIIDNVTIYN